MEVFVNGRWMIRRRVKNPENLVVSLARAEGVPIDALEKQVGHLDYPILWKELLLNREKELQKEYDREFKRFDLYRKSKTEAAVKEYYEAKSMEEGKIILDLCAEEEAREHEDLMAKYCKRLFIYEEMPIFPLILFKAMSALKEGIPVIKLDRLRRAKKPNGTIFKTSSGRGVYNLSFIDDEVNLCPPLFIVSLEYETTELSSSEVNLSLICLKEQESERQKLEIEKVTAKRVISPWLSAPKRGLFNLSCCRSKYELCTPILYVMLMATEVSSHPICCSISNCNICCEQGEAEGFAYQILLDQSADCLRAGKYLCSSNCSEELNRTEVRCCRNMVTCTNCFDNLGVMPLKDKLDRQVYQSHLDLFYSCDSISRVCAKPPIPKQEHCFYCCLGDFSCKECSEVLGFSLEGAYPSGDFNIKALVGSYYLYHGMLFTMENNICGYISSWNSALTRQATYCPASCLDQKIVSEVIPPSTIVPTPIPSRMPSLRPSVWLTGAPTDIINNNSRNISSNMFVPTQKPSQYPTMSIDTSYPTLLNSSLGVTLLACESDYTIFVLTMVVSLFCLLFVILLVFKLYRSFHKIGSGLSHDYDYG